MHMQHLSLGLDFECVVICSVFIYVHVLPLYAGVPCRNIACVCKELVEESGHGERGH